jgi:hypothetical protein
MSDRPPFSMVGIDHIVFIVDESRQGDAFLLRRAGMSAQLFVPENGNGAGVCRLRAHRPLGHHATRR